MKRPLILVFTSFVVHLCAAAPVAVHNKLVFTRSDSQGLVVWTMNADGGGAKKVWRVPKGYGQFGGFSPDGTKAISYNNFNLYIHDLKSGHF